MNRSWPEREHPPRATTDSTGTAFCRVPHLYVRSSPSIDQIDHGRGATDQRRLVPSGKYPNQKPTSEEINGSDILAYYAGFDCPLDLPVRQTNWKQKGLCRRPFPRPPTASLSTTCQLARQLGHPFLGGPTCRLLFTYQRRLAVPGKQSCVAIMSCIICSRIESNVDLPRKARVTSSLSAGVFYSRVSRGIC